MIQIKRIYDSVDDDDGYRILVDRLWPRGVSKEKAHIDLWMKEITPSTDLREWYNHDPEKWEEFSELYEKELKSNQSLMDEIKSLEKEHGKVTLLYGAKDTKHSNAIVLKRMLSK